MVPPPPQPPRNEILKNITNNKSGSNNAILPPPAVEMVNPMANDSESKNEFEWEPENADALKAKVGMNLFPHIL
jgi:hypothetical protein